MYGYSPGGGGPVRLLDVEGVQREAGLVSGSPAGGDRSCARPGGLLVRLAELGEHPGCRRRVEERHQPSGRALAGAGVEELQAELGEAVEAGLDVVDAIGDVVEATAPSCQEPGDLRLGPVLPSSSMRESPTWNMTASMPSDAITWRCAGAEPVRRSYAATARSRSATAIPTWSILVNALAIVGRV